MDDNIKILIRKIINVFENDSGSPLTDYSSLYIYNDGPNDVKQITISFGITEFGEMKNLINHYINNVGKYAEQFKPYVKNIGRGGLWNDNNFKKLLILASKEDEIFRGSEDYIYDLKYWNRALNFFNNNGFKLPLSLCVLMDSIIHSGSVLDFLRKRFAENVPVAGGQEKVWIEQYCKVRKNWLSNHSRKVLRNTTYRMDFMLEQIKNNNWDLNKFPIYPHGVKILE